MEKKPDIKIFVSHRIDLDSETIDNPLYVNVRCGAVFDKRENVDMLGDDTGDNISEKRIRFGEFTVMYWAWKNVKADYYGMCHYRRYLSFSPEKYPVDFDGLQHVKESNFNSRCIKKYKLNDYDKVKGILENQNGIVIEPIDIKKVPTPKGFARNIRQHWQFGENVLIKPDTIDVLRNIIKHLCPEWESIFEEYLKNSDYYGFNCFILERSLFFEMCEFVFPILFQLDKTLDVSKYSEWMLRTAGFMGELLVGCYIYAKQKYGKYTFKKCQLVYFENTIKSKNVLYPASDDNNIPIVLFSSDYDVPYVSIFIESVRRYSANCHYYDFIIFENNISQNNKKLLKSSIANEKNFSLRFVNLNAEFDRYDFSEKFNCSLFENYYKILVPYILREYDKAIITDFDTIVLDDIANLYKHDVDGYLAAGVIDIVYQGMLNLNENGELDYCLSKLGLKVPYNYIDSNILVVNLKEFRSNFKQAELLKVIVSKDLKSQEQDALNILLEDKVKYLDFIWNYSLKNNQWIIDRIKHAPYCNYKQHEKQLENAKILRWKSVNKPWVDLNVPYATIWWHYARETVFYELLLQRLSSVLCNQIHDNSTFVHHVADKYLPKGSTRRELLKKIMPRGSKQFEFLKKLYHQVTF